jgi:hypothetical protein
MRAVFFLAGLLAIAGNVTPVVPPGANGQGASRPGPRVDHVLVYHEARERVILLGGSRSANAPSLEEAWSWDGKRWELIDHTRLRPLV